MKLDINGHSYAICMLVCGLICNRGIKHDIDQRFHACPVTGYRRFDARAGKRKQGQRGQHRLHPHFHANECIDPRKALENLHETCAC